MDPIKDFKSWTDQNKRDFDTNAANLNNYLKPLHTKFANIVKLLLRSFHNDELSEQFFNLLTQQIEKIIFFSKKVEEFNVQYGKNLTLNVPLWETDVFIYDELLPFIDKYAMKTIMNIYPGTTRVEDIKINMEQYPELSDFIDVYANDRREIINNVVFCFFKKFADEFDGVYKTIDNLCTKYRAIKTLPYFHNFVQDPENRLLLDELANYYNYLFEFAYLRSFISLIQKHIKDPTNVEEFQKLKADYVNLQRK